MAVNITLNIQGKKVKGESQAANHIDEIDVLSWEWGLTQSASAHIATGAGTGSADVRDLTITKYVDKASPVLLQSCFQGTNFGGAVLSIMKVSGDAAKPLEYITITMGDKGFSPDAGAVFISSVSTGAMGENDRFIETVTLNFNKVVFTYNPQKSAGSGAGGVDGVMDIAAR
jgi:type VI secretion system secreted protein Hcp